MRILFWVAAAMCLSLTIPSAVWGKLCTGCFRTSGGGPLADSDGSPPHVLLSYPSCRARGGTREGPAVAQVLLDDLGDDARAHGAATLTDGEAQARIHGDRLDQLDVHGDVVARHDHLDALGQIRHARHVGRPEVELRA